MVPIKKGRPPQAFVSELKDYEAANGKLPSWEEIRCKSEVTAALVREQGGLCAYCMSRIEAGWRGSIQDAHVEHILPQSKSAHGEDVDYGNMLAVCEGKHGESRASWSCDRSRGNASMTVNPLRPQTLQSIRYRGDGTILSDDADVDDDLNNVLNLNGSRAGLKRNRKAVIDSLNTVLQAKGKRGGERAVKKYCRERLGVLSKLDADGKYVPYVGVLRFFLEKRLRR